MSSKMCWSRASASWTRTSSVPSIARRLAFLHHFGHILVYSGSGQMDVTQHLAAERGASIDAADADGPTGLMLPDCFTRETWWGGSMRFLPAHRLVCRDRRCGCQVHARMAASRGPPWSASSLELIEGIVRPMRRAADHRADGGGFQSAQRRCDVPLLCAIVVYLRRRVWCEPARTLQ